MLHHFPSRWVMKRGKQKGRDIGDLFIEITLARNFYIVTFVFIARVNVDDSYVEQYHHLKQHHCH
jgi:hypothetical protein